MFLFGKQKNFLIFLEVIRWMVHIGSPACQDRVVGGHAGVGVISLGGAPYHSLHLSLLSFRSSSGWVGY